MSLSGITMANLPGNLLFDQGVVFIGSTKIGVTRGAPKFNPNRSVENIPFDGKWAPVKGLDRPVNGEPVISFTMLELGSATAGDHIAKIEPGSTSAVNTGTTTHTPAPSGALLASGAYVVDLRVVWETGVAGTYKAIHFPVALCSKYDIAGQAKGEGLINVEFVGRIDLTAGATSDAAYTIEERTALP